MNAPTSVADAATALHEHGGEARAGGTDVTARLHGGRATGPFVDLHRLPDLRGTAFGDDGSVRIGAMTTIAEIAGDPRLRAGHPALTATAGALATPQIRTAGTLGGNLLQRNRCWYYRNPAFSCFQTGGDSCPAREGANLYSAVIDQGPCVAPHPSSMALALLAYDATVAVHGAGPMAVRDLYGDGSDPTRDHRLDPGGLLLAVDLPAPAPGETAAYHRATGRSRAEWPLVEAVARLVVDSDGVVGDVAVAAGAVARTPVRLHEVEEALTGRPATPESVDGALTPLSARCSPLAQNAYKVGLLTETVREVLERALEADGETPR
ncbi:xanthine dehydrogenase YagS FAD-binding subunit [Spinactinospora alkalitolerans]|uniref:Xanthine dehydrogenase YagS FAD-binding subunit n=1 Tax=Spinactinospora alkalitolerans TaxID=687207 RepID=A0A852TRN0_9ACTN|nr:FAD binding domain-containing protein [Spinactinospora alkalitolerans]NYE45353.1 xanthine dehydrogenase YagS FAD-binding subunit [Spinactinospora alkalitolerans]